MIYIGIIAFLLLFVIPIKQAKPKSKEHIYTASFGDPDEYLGKYNHGFAVTGSHALTKKQSYTNCLLCAPTGAGKTSVVILSTIVSLARGKSSIIINDVSNELWGYTSQYLADKGYIIKRIDFSNSKASQSFNPLLYCETIADIQQTALILIKNAIEETKGDSFWQDSAIMLLGLFFRYLIFHQAPEMRTLQNVSILVEKFAGDPSLVDKLFIRTNDEDLLTTYRATIATGQKTLMSIVATLRTALFLWKDSEVCKTTATNSLDLKTLRGDQPVAIFICNPLSQLQYYKPISALFIQVLFNFIMSRIPSPSERSVFFVLDEAATFKFPQLNITVSNIRKYMSGILICVQDEMALTAIYGQAQSFQIKTNCGCLVYLKGTPLHSAKEISQQLGKYTYTDEHGTQRTRELLAPDEVRLCDDALIFISNAKPLRCPVTPHYKNIWMSLSDKKPYVIPESELPDPPKIKLL